MAAGTDGEESFEEGHGKTSELAVQGWNGGKDPSWSVQKSFKGGKGEKGTNRVGKGQCFMTGVKEKGKKKVAKATPEFAGAVGKHGTLRQIAPRRVGTGALTL